jgi:hypothetical protein
MTMENGPRYLKKEENVMGGAEIGIKGGTA